MIDKKIVVAITICYLTIFNLIANAADFLVGNVSELDAALAKVKAGDVILWKDGKYKNVKIVFQPRVEGKEDKFIILKAQNDGKAVFTGNSQIFISGSYLQVEGFVFQGASTLEDKESAIKFGPLLKQSDVASHCRVTNCAIINYTRTEESGIDNNYIALEGTYNELDHCYFYGKTNKGPTVVVNYEFDKKSNLGTDDAPSTYHHIHHNYFGYRTFSSNGGEQIRVGVSGGSNTHGFNLVEYNYFEDERNEGEVISNKSCNNIYRFNTLIGNDGSLVLRNGRDCFAYGNYINGKSGRNVSGGLRVVNFNNTVFNNYLENIEGGGKAMKSPIVVMSGLVGAGINEYHAADSAIVAYNKVVNSVGPVIAIGVGNEHKGKPFVAPKNVFFVGNTLLNTIGENTDPFVIVDSSATFTARDNIYSNGSSTQDGFSMIHQKEILQKAGFNFVNQKVDRGVIDLINKRLELQHLKLSEKEIMEFDPSWIVGKKDVGVSWMK